MYKINKSCIKKYCLCKLTIIYCDNDVTIDKLRQIMKPKPAKEGIKGSQATKQSHIDI
jgi:hypothetical protein